MIKFVLKGAALAAVTMALCHCSNDNSTKPAIVESPKETKETPILHDGRQNLSLTFGSGRVGIEAYIVTPDDDFDHKGIKKHIAAKSVTVAEFNNTIQRRRFSLQGTLPLLPAGNVKLRLNGGVDVQDQQTLISDGKNPLKFRLRFVTASLTSQQQADGHMTETFDLVVETQRDLTHDLFQVTVYDDAKPTYVVERVVGEGDDSGGSCMIFAQPQQASGCFSNRTRATQEIVFNDGEATQQDITAEHSAGLDIAISILTLSFGIDKSVTNSHANSHGSEIHFINCIQCSSQVYRQTVDYIHAGDVYYMLVDGSTVWAGLSVLHNKEYAYEIVQTPPESEDYSCNLPSKLPVGRSSGCDRLFQSLR
jgi:hypothetical protein